MFTQHIFQKYSGKIFILDLYDAILHCSLNEIRKFSTKYYCIFFKKYINAVRFILVPNHLVQRVYVKCSNFTSYLGTKVAQLLNTRMIKMYFYFKVRVEGTIETKISIFRSSLQMEMLIQPSSIFVPCRERTNAVTRPLSG